MFGFMSKAEPTAAPRFRQGDKVRVSYIGTVRENVQTHDKIATINFTDGVFENVPLDAGPDGPWVELLEPDQAVA